MSERKKEESPPKHKNLGAITIGDGDLEQVKFWIRMFNLEAYVEAAKRDILSRPDVKKASVPIVSEHRSGELYWYFAIILFIDSLGFSGGMGLITFADETNRERAETKRNEVADFIMASINQQVVKGEMTGTVLTIEPTKE